MRPMDVSWGTLDHWALHLVGISVAFLVALNLAPIAIKKLRGAGMVGRDRHKPDRPEVAEMGGIIVFGGFMAGLFVMLMLADLGDRIDALVLATAILGCGAAIAGILDDFLALRQRFKAFLPFVFALPLALFVDDSTIVFPVLDAVDLGIAYALVLVPLAVACGSNSFNMLEGFNGLGAGLGLIMAVGISVAAWIGGDLTGLMITVPLSGALVAFLFYNAYPAKIFPGDTMTLFVGAMLVSAAILSKVEFVAGVLFLPFIVEFFLKAQGSFEVQSFAARIEGRRLYHEGPIRSLTHVALGRRGSTERTVVTRLWLLEVGLVAVTLAWLSFQG
ncbi:MAG: MraY family glycosyltransferase [Thermoplasmatota archaeon]